MKRNLVVCVCIAFIAIIIWESLVCYRIVDVGPLCNRIIDWHYLSEVIADLALEKTKTISKSREYVQLKEYDYETKTLTTIDGRTFVVISGFEKYSLGMSNTMYKNRRDGYLVDGTLYINYAFPRFGMHTSGGRKPKDLVEVAERYLMAIRFWKILPKYYSGNKLVESNVSLVK